MAIQEFIFWTTQSVRMFSLNLLVREYFLVLCSLSLHHHHHHNFSNNATWLLVIILFYLGIKSLTKSLRLMALAFF